MRFLIVLAALLPALPATAAPTPPTGKWLVDFADAQCVASRAYGEEQFFLKFSPMGDVVQVGLMRPAGFSGPRPVDALMRPGTGAAFKGSAIAYSPGKSGQRIYLVNLPVAEFNRLSGSPTLALQFGDLRRELAVSGMSALAKVMMQCIDHLQSIWIADDNKGPKAKANLGSYFTDGDYPADAIRWEESGTTVFALLVDESGRVADCMVTQTSKHASLDTQTCAILKARARFDPAIGADGKPRKGRLLGRIEWKLP